MSSREALTEKIVLARLKTGVTWKQLAQAIGKSPAWATAALLGQMSMSREEAQAAAKLLDLSDDDVLLLTTVPNRGSLGQAVPTDPLIYRLYELIQVYGTTFKALIEEE